MSVTVCVTAIVTTTISMSVTVCVTAIVTTTVKNGCFELVQRVEF
jgi:hypothetical protein